MIEPPSFVRGNACCGRPLLKVRQICENVEFLGTQSRRLVLIGVSPRAQGVRRGRGGNGIFRRDVWRFYFIRKAAQHFIPPVAAGNGHKNVDHQEDQKEKGADAEHGERKEHRIEFEQSANEPSENSLWRALASCRRGALLFVRIRRLILRHLHHLPLSGKYILLCRCRLFQGAHRGFPRRLCGRLP